jgi:hypothetical protein
VTWTSRPHWNGYFSSPSRRPDGYRCAPSPR